MGITPIELKEFQLRRAAFGYNRKDVETLRELCVEALTEATKEIDRLKAELRAAEERLSEHERRESLLKDTITTAQKMVEELKTNARKEADLIVAEAQHEADRIIEQAHQEVAKLKEHLLELKRQRVEFETELRSLLTYHMNLIETGEKEAQKVEEEASKLRFFKKIDE